MSSYFMSLDDVTSAEPTDADGVMKRKAVNLDNGTMKKSHNMALVFLCNET